MTNTQVARTEPASLTALLAHLAAEEKRSGRRRCRRPGFQGWRFEQIVTPAHEVIVGVPARTAQDALAALDYLVREKLIVETAAEYGSMVELSGRSHPALYRLNGE